MSALDKLRGLGEAWIGNTSGGRFQASALLAEIEVYASERRKMRAAKLAALALEHDALQAFAREVIRAGGINRDACLSLASQHGLLRREGDYWHETPTITRGEP